MSAIFPSKTHAFERRPVRQSRGSSRGSQGSRLGGAHRVPYAWRSGGVDLVLIPRDGMSPTWMRRNFGALQSPQVGAREADAL